MVATTTFRCGRVTDVYYISASSNNKLFGIIRVAAAV